MSTKTVTTRTIATYNPDEHCDICDLFKPLPAEKAMWDAGGPGIRAIDFYERGICISRGSNNDPAAPEKYCHERRTDWRKLTLLADAALHAVRDRETCEARVNNAVVQEKPDLAGTMNKVEAMQALGAAIEREEAAITAFEQLRGRR